MEGADDGDVQTGGLFQQGLYLRAVLAHDADVVPAGFTGPVFLHIQRAKLAEAIGGEQHLVGCIVGHDDLGPVDHGGGDEGQGMLAEAQSVALAHDNPAVCVVIAEELLHHGEGLGGGHHDGVGIDLQEVGNVGGVIRLHVLNDQIVGLPAGKGVLDVVQPLVGEVPVNGVHNGNLLVQNDVGVVGHAVGHHILALKQVNLVVVDAHIADIVGNLHTCSPLCKYESLNSNAAESHGIYVS